MPQIRQLIEFGTSKRRRRALSALKSDTCIDLDVLRVNRHYTKVPIGTHRDRSTLQNSFVLTTIDKCSKKLK